MTMPALIFFKVMCRSVIVAHRAVRSNHHSRIDKAAPRIALLTSNRLCRMLTTHCQPPVSF